jgi:uncharacterized membrane protein YhaH (DUF805 family)
MSLKIPIVGVMVFVTAFLLALSVERLHTLSHPGDFDFSVFIVMVASFFIGLLMSAITAVEIYKLFKKGEK